MTFQFDADQIFDDLWDSSVGEFSNIVSEGFKKHGRGVLFLTLVISPNKRDSSKTNVAVQDGGYWAYSRLRTIGLDEVLYKTLRSYNPKTRGVIMYITQPEDLGGGFFEFDLVDEFPPKTVN